MCRTQSYRTEEIAVAFEELDMFGPTPEEELVKLLEKIDRQISIGNYRMCNQIPRNYNDILKANPSALSKAKRLRSQCDSK